MSINRRRFVQGLAGGGLAAFSSLLPLGKALAAAGARRPMRALPKNVVEIFLLGGIDGQSVVVPDATLYPQYVINRSPIHYAASETLPLNGTSWRLHPALTDLQAAWNAGDLAIFHQVGYTTPTPYLSHFESQDTHFSGQVEKTKHATGWAGSVAAAHGWTSPTGLVALKTGNNLILHNDAYAALVLDAIDDFVIPTDMFHLDDSAYRNQQAALMEAKIGLGSNPPLVQALNGAASGAYELTEVLAAAVSGYTGPAYPGSPLGQSLRDIARLTYANGGGSGFDTRMFFTSTGGFDTHENQKPALQELLSGLDAALAAFRADLIAQNAWQETLILIVSEFGRKNVVNGSAGTDHGHGNNALVLGGAVNGGHYGTQPADVNHPTTPQIELLGEYFPNKLDFRQILYEILRTHLSVPSTIAAPILAHTGAPTALNYDPTLLYPLNFI